MSAETMDSGSRLVKRETFMSFFLSMSAFSLLLRFTDLQIDFIKECLGIRDKNQSQFEAYIETIDYFG